MSAAITAAVITVAGTAYAANEQKKGQKKAYQHATSEAERQRESDQNAIFARQNTPGARATPWLYDMALQVYGKAFGNHGFNLPLDDMFKAMNIGNLQNAALNDRSKGWQRGPDGSPMSIGYEDQFDANGIPLGDPNSIQSKQQAYKDSGARSNRMMDTQNMSTLAPNEDYTPAVQAMMPDAGLQTAPPSAPQSATSAAMGRLQDASRRF